MTFEIQPEDSKLTTFADACEASGLFTRRYDNGHEKLFEAAKIIWEHFCSLDGGHIVPAANMKLAEFSDLYVTQFNRGKGFAKHSKHLRKEGKKESG